jgi:hypothetical protein
MQKCMRWQLHGGLLRQCQNVYDWAGINAPWSDVHPILLLLVNGLPCFSLTIRFCFSVPGSDHSHEFRDCFPDSGNQVRLDSLALSLTEVTVTVVKEVTKDRGLIEV